jgi:hypothetical protein
MKLASLTDEMISIASTGDWGNLPEELQTEANLLLPDGHGWTAAHYAASEGMLHRIPKELLTERVLTATAPDGTTPLGLAAEMEWQNLPYEVLRMHKDLVDPDAWRKIRAYLERAPLEEVMELTNGDPFYPAETLEELS